MIQCDSKDTILRLFYNLSSSLLLLFIFFHFTSIFLSKLFIFLGGSPFYQRNQEGYEELNTFSDEEIEHENEYYGIPTMERKSDLLSGLIPDDHVETVAGDNSDEIEDYSDEIRDDSDDIGDDSDEIRDESDEIGDDSDEIRGDSDEIGDDSDEPLDEEELTEDNESGGTCYSTPATESSYEEVVEEEIQQQDSDSYYDSDENQSDPTSRFGTDEDLGPNIDTHEVLTEEPEIQVVEHQQKLELNAKKEEDFLVFQLDRARGKKLVPERDEYETSRDNFTIGSTSKDSSEWRSSIYCRDSGTEDPFSSSSRRSCPNWESYTVFQKYDEEMLYLDRISVQKLQETESLRSIQACPRSISERIVFSLKPKQSSEFRHNPYHELESAYVAQICLTWEALNWNYKHFLRLRASRREFDPGCPAFIAQQFQQFQVHLQRYVENEPYEYGRRPEIYARIRHMAPKLLQVPEYRDTDEDENREEGSGSRIPSNSFLQIMEESIRTFMNFLKQDKKSHCQILKDFFKKKKKGSADAILLLLLKKVNKQKKAKLKEIRRPGNCLRKRKLRKDEELEILMALIDLKVVSRVLRMVELNGEQLHWCENKMSKVKVSEGKLHRDSTPLFFTAN